MKNNIILFFAVGLILFPLSAGAQVMSNYTCNPVFISKSVKPNILILLDTSWEMNNMAYGWDDPDELYRPSDYVHDPVNNPYTGYFNPVLKYNYAGGGFDVAAGGDWDGNFLNWLTMRRVDIARKVLVGGDGTPRSMIPGKNTLLGEVPPNSKKHEKYWKFFKIYEFCGSVSPYANNQFVFKISQGKIEVYEVNTPAGLLQNSDFKTYCMSNDAHGHEAFMEDYYFEYDSCHPVHDYRPYNVYEKSGANGGCDAGLYDTGTLKTTLTYVAEYAIAVDVEPADGGQFDGDGHVSGILQQIDNKARFGIMWFNEGGKTELDLTDENNLKDGGYMNKYVDDALTPAAINAIENKSCSDLSPIAETFFDGLAYYMQGNTYSMSWAGHDPFNYSGSDVGCGDNFILIVGGGESSVDINIPQYNGVFDFTPDLRDYDDDSGGDDGTGSAANNWETDYLDDIAFWARTTDLRPPGATEVDDFNNVITYAVFAFGKDTGSQRLKEACKNGGFVDRDGDSKPDTVGDARGGQWADFGSNEEWDADNDGDPDTYFEASGSGDLRAKILQAIDAILQRAASGTAVSILSTSSEGEGSLFQAFFKPRVIDNLREITWVGYLNALWVDPYGNLREDTIHDDALVYAEDKIIQFTLDPVSGDTAIKRFHDSDGDGMADIVAPATEPAPYETVLLPQLDPQWEAGEKLALRDADTRTIKTWVDINGDGEVDENVDVTGDGIPEADGEYIDFHETNASILRPFLDVATDDEAAYIINFIRGEASSTSYRDRDITIGASQYVWKLGDIVYSTPTVVGKPMERYNEYYSDVSYAQFLTDATYPGQPGDVKLWEGRGVTVYVGANDGMLHAFKAGTFQEGDNPATAGKEEHGWYSTTEYPPTTEGLGEERWAYIPYHLLPHLKWLTRPDYTHVYYVDLKPKVTDVRIFYDPATGNSDDYHPNGWGTILIGGMRLGGGEYTFNEDFDGDGSIEVDEGDPGGKTNPWTFRSAYFAIDITVPNNPVLLAEITDPAMGFTTSYPAITRVEDNTGDDKWYCIVGSGPTGCDGDSDQEGYVYAFSMGDGGLDNIFGPFENFAFMANPITIDNNLNYNVDSIYIGETYDPANDSIPANDLGKMYHVSTRDNNNPAPDADPWPYETDPANWVESVFFTPTTPITASATASIDEDENIWVYFGTGRYYKSEDKSDVTQQYFYGMKDPCAYGVCPVGSDAVADGDLLTATNIVVLTNNELEGVPVGSPTEWDSFIEFVQANYDGWKIDLSADGERLLNRPSVLGGVVLFAPFNPDDDICAYGGTGALYALYYETGTAYPEDILGTIIRVGDGKEVSLKMISLDKGITSEIGLHVGQKAESTGFIQQGTGKVFQVEVDTAFDIRSGLIGWMQY